MQELFCMFFPRYSVSKSILKNVASVEYGRSVIENVTILPNWQKQLEKDALFRSIYFSWLSADLNFSKDLIKACLNGFSDKYPPEIENYIKALSFVERNSKTDDLDEEMLKRLHTMLGAKTSFFLKSGVFRNKSIEGVTNPEEILAEMVELFDWYHSLDSKDTHPLIVAGIMKAKIETIQPFETANSVIAGLVVKYCLKARGYEFSNCCTFDEYFAQSRHKQKNSLAEYIKTTDLTNWLEYFTDLVSYEVTKVGENVVLLAKDSKVARVSGGADLTDRQRLIVEYLQDFISIGNKDFSRLFPTVSEDSVLRDLKYLIKLGIVVKNGSTKSSRYRLK